MLMVVVLRQKQLRQKQLRLRQNLKRFSFLLKDESDFCRMARSKWALGCFERNTKYTMYLSQSDLYYYFLAGSLFIVSPVLGQNNSQRGQKPKQAKRESESNRFALLSDSKKISFDKLF